MFNIERVKFKLLPVFHLKLSIKSIELEKVMDMS